MGKEKVPICKCKNRLKRIYSRYENKYKCLNFYFCDKCQSIYKFKIEKIKIKNKVLKTKKNIK